MPPCARTPDPSKTGDVDPKIQIRAIQSSVIRGRIIREHLSGAGIEFDERVSPICFTVIGAVSGGDEYVAGGGIDHGSRPTPDRRPGRLAGRGLEQAGVIAAQGVPDAEQAAALRIENGHVALVGRRIADVAAGDRNDAAVEYL